MYLNLCQDQIVTIVSGLVVFEKDDDISYSFFSCTCHAIRITHSTIDGYYKQNSHKKIEMNISESNEDIVLTAYSRLSNVKDLL